MAIEKGYIVGKDEKRDTLIIDYEKVKEELTKIVRQARKENKTIVIDSHHADILPRKYVTYVIVLRLNPKELFNRLIKKGWSIEKVKENVEAELVDHCLIKAVEAYGTRIVKEIDVTGLNEEQSARRVLDSIYGICVSEPGSVDWLKVLEEDEVLRKTLQQ